MVTKKYDVFRREWLQKLWVVYANVSGVLLASFVGAYVLVTVVLPGVDDPVVTIEKFELLTPKVRVGESFTFRVWRKSHESCPGTGVVAFTSMSRDKPSVVISARYPLATPGYNSPPLLTVTREMPREVYPGKWHVRTGVESQCPLRNRYDQTGEFVLEVTE